MTAVRREIAAAEIAASPSARNDSYAAGDCRGSLHYGQARDCFAALAMTAARREIAAAETGIASPSARNDRIRIVDH